MLTTPFTCACILLSPIPKQQNNSSPKQVCKSNNLSQHCIQGRFTLVHLQSCHQLETGNAPSLHGISSNVNQGDCYHHHHHQHDQGDCYDATPTPALSLIST
jgi:hypothetical protein